MKRNKRSKATKRNIKDPKTKPLVVNQQRLNNCQFTVTNDRFRDHEDGFKHNDAIVQASPRPTTLSSRWTYTSTTEYKRFSGSECEDFKTPSMEYDMTNEITFANEDYDQEWDEIGLFNDDRVKCNGHAEKNGFGESFNDVKIKLEDPVMKHSTNGIRDIDDEIVVDYTQHFNCVSEDNTCMNNKLTNVSDLSTEYSTNEIKMVVDGVLESNAALNGENTELIDLSMKCSDQKTVEEEILEVNSASVSNSSLNDRITMPENLGTKYSANETVDGIQLNDRDFHKTTCVKTDVFDDNFGNIKSDEETLDLICTEENLRDEILPVRQFTIELSYEANHYHKAKTLQPQSMIESFIKSATSITNVTSITGSDSVINIDKPEPNRMKKCKDFLKKIKFGKGSAKKEVKFSNGDTAVLPVSLTDNRTADQKTKKKETKIKSNIFKILFSKKRKNKKETEIKVDVIVEPKLESNCNVKKAEIEFETLDEFNKTLISLIRSEDEKKCSETVKINQYPQKEVNTIMDTSVVSYIGGESLDHMFPDSVTASKIIPQPCYDVPFMDDHLVAQLDFVSFYNGESRLIRINPMFVFPMASTESLCSSNFHFMDDSFIIEEDNMVTYNGENKKNLIHTDFSVPIASVESFYVSADSVKSEGSQHQ